MSIILVPATGVDRIIAGRIWSRVDQIEGYPRTHEFDEVGWQIGSNVNRAPHTESEWSAIEQEDVIAIFVGDTPERLASRSITIDSTVRTLEQWLDYLRSNQGWQILNNLPSRSGDWQSIPVRFGAEGSLTGVPIPEGEELIVP